MSQSPNRCDSPYEVVPEPGHEAYDMQHSYSQQNTDQPGILTRGYNMVQQYVESKKDKIVRLEREVENLKFEVETKKYDINRLEHENRCYREAYNDTIANVRSLNDEVDRLKNECQQYKTDLENLNERCHKKEREVERLSKDIKDNKEKMVQAEKKWKLRLADADSKSRELMDKVMKSVQDNRELQYKLISYKTTEEEKERVTASLNAESRKCEQMQRENDSHRAKIMDLEREIRRLTNEMSMMDSVNKKIRLENEQLLAELRSERERAVNTHGQTTKQCGDLMLVKYSEFELEKENIKKDFNKRIEELNSTIMKHVDDKFRLRKEHSADIEALCADNGALIAKINSKHEAALKQKDAEIKKIIDNFLQLEKERSREMEKLTAAMANKAETTSLMYEQALKSNNEEACEFINRMYEDFKQATDKQSERLKEARMKERAWKQRFQKLIEEVHTDDRFQPDDEQDESSGVQIEEVFD